MDAVTQEVVDLFKSRQNRQEFSDQAIQDRLHEDPSKLQEGVYRKSLLLLSEVWPCREDEKSPLQGKGL